VVSAEPRCGARAAFTTSTVISLLILAGLGGVSAQPATPVASPMSTEQGSPLPPAWLEFGPDGILIARIIVESDCPAIALDGFDVVMTPRSTPSAAFPVIGCEAPVPFGTEVATIGGQDLPLPNGQASRIAVIGDTGCRLNDWEGKYQACNDPEVWPFAQVAESVAEWNPDLIVHVGDYLYRESACPTGMDGCEGSPHGDNWATWNADFFAPVSPLLGIAPWVFMRGNHETCDRNPEGWFTYLDPRPFQSTCQRFTEPYISPVLGLSFAVIDSAEAADTTVTPEEQTEYARQFDLLSEITPPGSWLVTHRPVWGILSGKSGEFEVENAAFEATTGGSLKADYSLILSGHIHLAESIAFDAPSDRPPQLISGNAGTALDDIPTASPMAGQLGDPTVAEAETLSAFGFMTLERDGENWIAVQRDQRGAPLLGCILELPEMSCESVE
jgi:Calcineurin-like phosphoesterase